MTTLIESRRNERDTRKLARLKLLAEKGNPVAKKELEKVKVEKPEPKQVKKKTTKKGDK